MLQKSEGNLPSNSLKNLEKKTLRTLLVKTLPFNNKLIIRDNEFCVNKWKNILCSRFLKNANLTLCLKLLKLFDSFILWGRYSERLVLNRAIF